MLFMKRVTIQDVADKAEVSPTAVSFAFNKPDQLNPDTVTRIRSVAWDMGYVPNPHARALISRRTGVIGVLVPQAISAIFANPFFDQFLQGVGSVCDKHDMSLLTISPVNSSLDQALGRAPVDGFIIVGVNEDHTEVAPLRKRNVPFVIVDGDATAASSVNVEDAIGTYDAAAHLLSRGHRDILILSLPQPEGHSESAQFGVRARRLGGYTRAFNEYGARCDGDCIRSTESSIRGGETAFDEAWNGGARPSAILAMSDVIAIGAMRAAQRRGLHIPRDLEVIGFDDIVLSSLVQPSLSTVHQPIIEKGMRAIQLLIAAMDDEGGPQHIMLKTSLINRGSTKQ